jgi:hypothetical protein
MLGLQPGKWKEKSRVSNQSLSFALSQGLKLTLASGKYLRNNAAVVATLLAISRLLTFELAFISGNKPLIEIDIISSTLLIKFFFF